MKFEVKSLKFTPNHLRAVVEDYEHAKSLAVRRAKDTKVRQLITSIPKGKWPTYIVTPDGWQINRKTQAKFQIKEF